VSEIRDRDRRKRGIVSSGFTLLELLVVIFLVSLMAMLVFGTMAKKKDEKRSFDIRQIKTLLSTVPNGGAELVCTEECRHCVWLSGEERTQKEGGTMDGKVAAYLLDPEGGGKRIDFGRYGDKKVCLRFRYYENGSTSQMIVAWQNAFYFIPAYFGKVRRFPRLQEAVEYWREKNGMLQSAGDYY
jgi:prepilin-type N-terminal cleavage/methylation domain-containing protein